MEPFDLDIRNATYRLFADGGAPPSRAAVAVAAGADETQVADAWQRLHDVHALVLDPASRKLRMANPFSAVPTAHRVKTDGRDWYANCAWDAIGICAALDSDGVIETECPDCASSIRLEVSGKRIDDETLLFHALVPATRWWDDIAFT
jgi:Alkylmercury lyase